ncbi:hypothetical protein CYMTET_12918 [Cymbomonas tetramitiformis]|uniref:Uncharacterized protein n=1 Tax=Cymbomonas tetramitiformis TaxID=36881 RepID=A0AAE0GKR1_9CHLO|nr:hypothetical protein CYMTET_12918 [Cymbomonas tetramitiformis]
MNYGLAEADSLNAATARKILTARCMAIPRYMWALGYPVKERLRVALGITVGHDVEDHKAVPYLHKAALTNTEAPAQEAPALVEGDALAPEEAPMVVIHQVPRTRETKEEAAARRQAKREAVLANTTSRKLARR